MRQAKDKMLVVLHEYQIAESGLSNHGYNRFPPDLSVEIFDYILNKALNNRMVDHSVVLQSQAEELAMQQIYSL